MPALLELREYFLPPTPQYPFKKKLKKSPSFAWKYKIRIPEHCMGGCMCSQLDEPYLLHKQSDLQKQKKTNKQTNKQTNQYSTDLHLIYTTH